MKEFVEGGRAQKEGHKVKAPQPTPNPPKPPKPTPSCALCVVVLHATNNCPQLPHIKNLVSDTFPKPNILEVHVTLPESAKKNKTLCTKKYFDFCDKYGHYSNHRPHLEDFHDTLEVLCELNVAHSGSTFPLPVVCNPNASRGKEGSQPPIVIPPPDVEMTDSSTPILYLSSSMGSIYLHSS